MHLALGMQDDLHWLINMLITSNDASASGAEVFWYFIHEESVLVTSHA